MGGFKNKNKRFLNFYHKDINKKIWGLEKQIFDIENSSSIDINMNRKRELENQLNEIIYTKSRGAQIRSRANWVNEGEKNTKYFLSLEKKNQSNNVTVSQEPQCARFSPVFTCSPIF